MCTPTSHSKPVPRAALYTPTSPSASPEPDLEEQLHAHLARLYSPSIPPLTTTTTTRTKAPRNVSDLRPSETPHDPLPSNEGQTYEFRLFSTPTTHSTAPPTQKVVIRSPTPTPKDAVGGFVIPHRARGYYFSDDGAGAGTKRKRRREFEEVGVSAEDVLRHSRVKWPGCALPWRVVTLHLSPRYHPSLPSSTSSSPALAPQSSLTPAHGPRRRPGKKRRLALHKALAASKALAATREMSAREREVAEREKRTRRNREKKVKRKMKGKGAKKNVEGKGEEEGEGG